jgi:hypothetical protein
MKINKKLSLFLSTIIISLSILFLSSTAVEAKASAIVILTNDGSYYEYNYDALKSSAVASDLGDTVNGALYDHFLQNETSINAYYDDLRNVYVSSSAICEQAVNSALNKTTFDFKAYIENSSTPSTTVITKKVQNNAGTITVDGTADSSDFDVSKFE